MLIYVSQEEYDVNTFSVHVSRNHQSPLTRGPPWATSQISLYRINQDEMYLIDFNN